MTNILLVALGGALGALSRYAVTLLLAKPSLYVGIPLGTSLVNIIGSFALAFMLTLSPLSPQVKLALGTGFLGAFTTFSTFEVDFYTLIVSGKYVRAGGYLLLNVCLAFVAVVAAVQLAQRLKV